MTIKKINFMCTAFRDGFQSAYGARVFSRDYLPAVEAARNAGIQYFEAGGGATFQSLLFYCQEDPFKQMEAFRRAAGNQATLQTLARGVNVVGLESQPGDVIRLHAQLFKKHGIDVIRNFDALNDVNNLIHSGQCIVEAGLKHQVCITIMELPPGCTGAHDAPFYASTLKQILDAGIPFDSVCFKDASGTAVPSKVFETIQQARQLLGNDVNIHFHTHETAGIGVAAYMAALEGGADTIDLSLAPCSGGTCQTDVLVMWHALRGSRFDLGVDIDKIREAEEVLKECMKDYFLPPEATAVEPSIPWSPMPGGALTANTQMLRDNGIMDRYPEVIKAMSEVVRKGGFGTSVTPVSQFYFQQAFNNVIFGPWKKIAEGYGQMVLGYFGKTPVPADAEVIRLASDQLGLAPTNKTALEINDADSQKGLVQAGEHLRRENLPETDENLFIVATCRDKGIKFLKGQGELGVRKISEGAGKEENATVSVMPIPAATPEPCAISLNIDGQFYDMKIEPEAVTLNGNRYQVSSVTSKTRGHASHAVSPQELVAVLPANNVKKVEVKAQLPGKIYKVIAKPGSLVKANAILLVLEAMKMEIEIRAPAEGRIAEILVTEGQQVSTGQSLVNIQPHC